MKHWTNKIKPIFLATLFSAFCQEGTGALTKKDLCTSHINGPVSRFTRSKTLPISSFTRSKRPRLMDIYISSNSSLYKKTFAKKPIHKPLLIGLDEATLFETIFFQVYILKEKEKSIKKYPPKFPQYESLDKRLESYKKWPEHRYVNACDLAEAGLVYTGVGDSVRCYFCGGGLRNWEEGDIPQAEHNSWYPECKRLNPLSPELIEWKSTFSYWEDKYKYIKSENEVYSLNQKDINETCKLSVTMASWIEYLHNYLSNCKDEFLEEFFPEILPSKKQLLIRRQSLMINKEKKDIDTIWEKIKTDDNTLIKARTVDKVFSSMYAFLQDIYNRYVQSEHTEPNIFFVEADDHYKKIYAITRAFSIISRILSENNKALSIWHCKDLSEKTSTLYSTERCNELQTTISNTLENLGIEGSVRLKAGIIVISLYSSRRGADSENHINYVLSIIKPVINEYRTLFPQTPRFCMIQAYDPNAIIITQHASSKCPMSINNRPK